MVYPTIGIDGKRYEKIVKDTERYEKMGKDGNRRRPYWRMRGFMWCKRARMHACKKFLNCENIGKFEECADFVEVENEAWVIKKL